MHKYVTAISLKTTGLQVLKLYCYSKEVCVFVALHCNNLNIMHGIINLKKNRLKNHIRGQKPEMQTKESGAGSFIVFAE